MMAGKGWLAEESRMRGEDLDPKPHVWYMGVDACLHHPYSC
jgi:hypothetical protein